MLGLIARRLLAVVPVLLVVTFVIFGLVTLIPGDAATTLAGGPDAPPEYIEQVREQLNLDEPIVVQYAEWLKGAVRLDFGDSLFSERPVRDEVAERLPVTLGLTALALALAVPLALLVGILSGLRPGSLPDRLLMFGSSASISMPSFWVALLLIALFAAELQWLPPFGYTAFVENPIEWFRSMVMPASALALTTSAIVARQLRGGLADTMGSGFIRTAWAKGGSTTQVVVGHALKNSTIPAVTVLGVQIGVILGGTVVIEQVFLLPGLGTYLMSAISYHDLPAVQACAVLFVIAQLVVTLAVDITYGYLDPKVRLT